jgi:protein TonB
VLLVVLGVTFAHVGVRRPAYVTKVEPLIVPPAPVLLKERAMGGGGGHHDRAPVTQGRLPKAAEQQIVPVKAPPTEAAKIQIAPTVVMQRDLKMASTLPDLGVPNSTLRGVSLGNGAGTGIGAGNGSGVGPGSGGNVGGGVMRVGGTVKAPIVLLAPEPEYSEEARKAKFAGNVVVYLVVDDHGNPTHVHAVRGVGMGLDEKAVEAVEQYKFKPATQNGKPVAVEMYIDVGFQIF